MKRNYWIIGTIAVAIAAIVAVVALVVPGGEEPEEADGDITEERTESLGSQYLEDMQLDPPDDYIGQLKDVISTGTDQYIRERGIFTLTDIAIREGDTGEIIDFLKDVAMNESDENVRTAAYANVDLIRQAHPLPERGVLEVSISGEIKKESMITLIASISATIDVSDAIVGIQRLHQDIVPISSPATNMNLQAGEKQTFECELKLNGTGEYSIPVMLMLSFDRLDYEAITREVVLTVNEADGEYEVNEAF